MRKKPSKPTLNRSGAAVAPGRTARTAQGAQAAGIDPQPRSFHGAHARFQEAWASELEPLGRVPPPVGAKGMASALMARLRGRDTTVLLDALGARGGFERTGTRLYEGLLAKHALTGGWDGGPTRVDLLRIRDEEHGHFRLCVEAVRQLGGDPTAMTPMADVDAVLSRGLEAVIADPRTSLYQALHAIHVAELADNDAWALLVRLAEGFGLDDLAADFREAMATESEHLTLVRGWVEAWNEQEAGVPPEPELPVG